MKTISLTLALLSLTAFAQTAEDRFNALPESKKEELRERMRKL